MFLFLHLLVAVIALPVDLVSGSSTGGKVSRTMARTTTSTNFNATNGSYKTFWKPAKGTTWQIELLNVLSNTSADAQVYDIDLFDNSADTITKLHGMGRKVICYFSAGSREDWRPDANKFNKNDYGKALDGWAGESWLDTRSPHVRTIMQARLDLAAAKGCDGVDPDNVDGYETTTGFRLTKATAVNYLTFLASEAHSRGLAIGLKNALEIVGQTLDMMQWAINESCITYNECDSLQPFVKAGKPVFHIEYPDDAPNIKANDKAKYCKYSSKQGFSTVLKNMVLDDWLYTC